MTIKHMGYFVQCDSCKEGELVKKETKKAVLNYLKSLEYTIVPNGEIYCPVCAPKRTYPKHLSPGKRS